MTAARPVMDVPLEMPELTKAFRRGSGLGHRGGADGGVGRLLHRAGLARLAALVLVDETQRAQ
jgi:hypothetical protein